MAYRIFSSKKGYGLIQFPKQFFVTGTDTDVGKTVVSSLLMSSLNATYWKPIQAGLDEETDTEFVQRVSESKSDVIIPEAYRLNTPMSPHAAADIDSISISLDDFSLPDFNTENLVVEGAGGLIVPINWDDTVLDLIEQFKLPVLLVARSTLGTLNHTLLSLEALRARNIEVFGVVLNGPAHQSNKETIEYFSKVKVYELGTIEQFDKESLSETFNEVFVD